MLKYYFSLHSHLKRLAWIRLVSFLLLLFTVNIFSFIHLTSLYFYFIAVMLMFITGVGLMFLSFRSLQDKRESLPREVEITLFGRRRLVLDTILELFQNRGRQDLMQDSISLLEQQSAYDDWKNNIRKRQFRDGIYYSAAIILLLGLALWQLPDLESEIGGLREFYSRTYSITLPEFYLENESWTLDLSGPARDFDDLELQVGQDILQSTNNIFIINKQWTALPALSIKVRVWKKGLSRIIYQGRVEQLRSFLPRDIAIQVSYPFGVEQYSGLQDLEVWSGARIRVQGDMNYSVQGINIPGLRLSGSHDKRNFSFSFTIYRSASYQLEVKGIHNLKYLSPPFKVQVLPNQPPRISLLFPRGDVVLGHYQWRVQALVEGEDDQGIRGLYYRVIVTNKDPYLNFKQEKQFSLAFKHLRYIRQDFTLKYTDLEMLPGDIASVTIWLEDSLGKSSAKVGFDIISPDIWQLQQQREKLKQEIQSSSTRIVQQVEKLRKDVDNKNLSGAEQKAKDIKQEVESLDKQTDSLAKSHATQEEQITEVQDSLKRMEEITRKLKQYSETLEDMQKIIKKTSPQAEEFQENTKSMEELLQEFEAMLDNLEYYKKYTDMAQQFDLLEESYQQLKEQQAKPDFERNKKSYQKALKDFKDLAFPDMQDKINALAQESDSIKQGDEQSYQPSDKMMQQLKRQVQDKMSAAGQDRMEQRKQDLEVILHELFLDQIVLEQTRSLDPGRPGNYDVDQIARIVEQVNALISSVNDSGARLESVLTGLIFSDPQALKAVNDLVARNKEILGIISLSLRDNRMNEVGQGLSQSANHISLLFLKVLQISQAMDEAMKKSGQQGSPQMSLSMDQLMQMQSQMSSSLQEIMKQMQQQGMSPQMKEMMDQMARLQSQIRDNLAKAQQQGQDGVLSDGQQTFGLMDDIIKDLESYKIKKSTLEKSKQIEKKLLKAKKSLQSKGISQKRKSNSPGSYQVDIIPDIPAQESFKIDLNSIQDKKLDAYYKKLIEKYRSQSAE